MGIFNSVPKDPTDTPALQALKKKAMQAMNYVALAQGPTGPPEDKGVRIQGDNGEIVDIWWSKELAQLILAFKVPPDCLTEQSDMTTQPKCLEILRALDLKEGTVTIAPSLSKVMDDLLSKKALVRVMPILGGMTPRSVICTGADVGGSVAAAAAVLLAVEFPSAEVRCVTVNAPVITYGNAAFATLYRYLVGFSYHLNTSELLSLLPPDETAFPLYGQWAKSQSTNLKPTPFDPTKATPENWSAEEMQKVDKQCGAH
eukprot:jgi/Botrbrau1/4316/Bobra.0232s0008.1